MDEQTRERIEAEARLHWEAERFDQATTVLVRDYGPEVFGFLISLARDADLAADAFSIFCEDVWKGVGGFRGDASFRTWCYVLARNALHRARRHGQRRNHVPLSNVPELAELVARVRTTTLVQHRTETRDTVSEMRSELLPEDQELLILRVDRGLAWDEIATVVDSNPLDTIDRRRRSAALRKRYERLKERLRQMARDRGLL
jgi:RNA polymerase sigma-70 factor, ECF subfamily